MVEEVEKSSAMEEPTSNNPKAQAAEDGEEPEEGEILTDDDSAKPTTAAVAQPHPLEHSWTFWFDSPAAKSKQVEWGSSLRPIYTFSTVEEFWGDTLECYLLEMEKIAMTLLGLMAKALKIEKREIEEIFADGMRSVRLTYYPPCPQPEMVMGLTPHSDAIGITILHQVNGVEGLQIKKDGVWIPVNFLPDVFVVNVGDILEILSNGLYHSIEHRATVNSVKERISLATFFNLKLEAEVGPEVSLLTPPNPPLFKRVVMEEYVKDFFPRRLNGKSFLDHMKI